jgi:hypothetical protein
VAQVDAPRSVRQILLLRESEGKIVRRLVGERVGRQAAGFAVGSTVGVNGNEQVGPGFPRDGHPIGERQENIVVAGQFDGNAARPAQLARNLPRDVERDFLLQRTAHADGARIMASMAGIDHHKAMLRGRRGAVRLARRSFLGCRIGPGTRQDGCESERSKSERPKTEQGRVHRQLKQKPALHPIKLPINFGGMRESTSTFSLGAVG